MISPPRRPSGPQVHGNLAIELVWTLVPLLIVLVLIVVTFQAQNRINYMSPRPTLVVPDDLGILPYPSIFPFALGLGLTIALTGLVFGFWPLLLGGGLAKGAP